MSERRYAKTNLEATQPRRDPELVDWLESLREKYFPDLVVEDFENRTESAMSTQEFIDGAFTELLQRYPKLYILFNVDVPYAADGGDYADRSMRQPMTQRLTTIDRYTKDQDPFLSLDNALPVVMPENGIVLETLLAEEYEGEPSTRRCLNVIAKNPGAHALLITYIKNPGPFSEQMREIIQVSNNCPDMTVVVIGCPCSSFGAVHNRAKHIIRDGSCHHGTHSFGEIFDAIAKYNGK